MADFPELGQKYTSLEDDYDCNSNFILKIVLLVVILVLCVVTVLNTLQIQDLKQTNEAIMIELSSKTKDVSMLKKENEEQERQLRLLNTDVRILTAIAEGIDPYHTEEE